jgi:hypothetical protein
MNIEGPYAFLSPCVAKSDEFCDPNTGGLIAYNVTYRKLLEYLSSKGIDFTKSEPAEYDNDAHGMGSIYCAPGGLKANLEQYIKDKWVFRIEGQPQAGNFLHEYTTERDDVPFLVDILNCRGGCNTGTGAYHGEYGEYAVGKAMHKVYKEVAESKQCEERPPGPDFTDFDKQLELEDFMRKYTPKKITPIFVDRTEMEEAFTEMHKSSNELRTHDCRRCGYATCQEMAVAIAKGLNLKENCIDYYRGTLKKQNQSGGSL